jgi:putrescine transport system substrate-binding protein
MTMLEETRKLGLTRRIGLIAAAAAAVIALSACNPGKKDAAGDGKIGGQVNVYNWSDYIDPEILTDFEKETGIKVVYDTYDNNEIVETKLLQGGSGYDLAVPSAYVAKRLIDANAIEQLDLTKLPNRKNLWTEITQRVEPFDPGLAHVVPYMWGTVGMAYDPAKIKARMPNAPLDSWSLALDPANLARFKDCGVIFLDSPEEMFSIMLKYLGKDPQSQDPADFKLAADHFLKLRPFIQKFHSSESINLLGDGTACLAIGYSGDMLQARTRAEEAKAADPKKTTTITYVIPKEGTELWFDNFIMPKDAPNKEQAYAFLNYMLRPEVIAKATNFVTYANANSASKPLVDEAIRNDPMVYPSDAVLATLWVTRTKPPELLTIVSDSWEKVRTGR